MNYNFLQSINRKQFEKTMKLEGQTVFNVNKNVEETIFFSKTKNGKTSQDRLSIYCNAECSIKKGDILKFKDRYYIVLNENYYENDIWRHSILVKCNSIWTLFGQTVPLVASDLGSTSPSNGTFLSTISGTFNLYTSDMQILHEKINIDDSFFDFGGVYKLVNKFFIDGMAYLYFQRGLLSPTEPSINRDGNSIAFKLSDGSTALIYYVGDKETKFYLPGAKLNYSVSDESVATIDENGVLTFIAAGKVSVTVTSTVTLENGGEYKVYNISKTEEFTIVEGTPTPTDPDPENPDNPDVPDNPDTPVDPEPEEPITWSITQDLADNIYGNSTFYSYFTIAPSKETNAVVTWKLYLDTDEYPLSDFADYMETDITEYSFGFKLKNNDLSGYNFHIIAVIDDVPTLTSNTARIAMG